MEECQRIRDYLEPLSDKDKLLIIMTDPKVRESLIYSTGGSHLSFITKDWDGNEPPHAKEVLCLTDGSFNWIFTIMDALEIGERGSE